jgi:hypothetical protein
MGRYEVQLFDSWGVKTPTFADMGGIYQRWDESRGAGREGYEGTPPAVNASRAPGLWQHLEISFRAPRFEGKKKVANARFLRVVLNGVTVQENVEVTGPTRAALFTDERATGPLMIQGDHGPVAVRNIEYKSYTGVAKLSDLTYKAWAGEGIDTTWMTSRPPMREGAVTMLSSAPAAATNRFAIAYAGALTVPAAGRYRFTLNIDWVGTEAAMQGPAVARADLSIDGKPVIVNRGAQQGMQADVDLAGGKHAFALTFFKNRQWGDQRDVKLFIEGPGLERQPLHDESLLAAFGNPINPIMVQATTEPVVLRSFEWHRGQKRAYVASVADPLGVHYSYDLSRGAPFYVWRGPFLETTQMWNDRGEDQSSRPMGSVVDLAGLPSLAVLSDSSAAWPDSLNEQQFRRDGYKLDKSGRPTFLYHLGDIEVEDDIRPTSDGLSLRRELRLHTPSGVDPKGVYLLVAQAPRIAGDSKVSGLITNAPRVESTPEMDASEANLALRTFVVGDGGYYVRLASAFNAPAPQLRLRNGQTELLVPVQFMRGNARLMYTIIW